MKKCLCLTLALLLLLGLTACAGKEDVEYYVTKRFVVYDTGDTNLIEYTYDDQWRPLGSKTLLNDVFASSVENVYNEDGTEVTVTTRSAIYDGDTTVVHQKFDEKGRLELAQTLEEGAVQASTQYFYDDKDRLVKTIGSAADTEYQVTTERTYDDMGNLLTFSTDTGLYASHTDYTYDSKGRCLSRHDYQGQELTGYVEYTWEGNTQYGSIYYPDGSLQKNTIRNTYDDAGNLLEELTLTLRGDMVRCTYHEYTATDGTVSSGFAEATN